MKSSMLISTLVLNFVLSCVVVRGQFYSSTGGGVTLPRNGKRSYLASLVKSPSDNRLPSILESSSTINSQNSPAYYQTDKLSFRKLWNKFGKRSDLDYTEPSLDYNQQLSLLTNDDYLANKELIDFVLNSLINKSNMDNRHIENFEDY